MSDEIQQARRVREQARRARMLAVGMADADQARAIRFAEELEEKAERLEQLAAAGPPSLPVVHQEQQQAQQQQSSDPADKPKPKD